VKVGDFEVTVEARVIAGADRVELVLVGEYTALGLVVLGVSEVAVEAGRTGGPLVLGDAAGSVATLANEMLVALADAFDAPVGEN
jgi:hypothetical protein